MDSDSRQVVASAEDGRPVPQLLDYLWRPLPIKLWWISIPLYWVAIGGPTRPTMLDGLARGVVGMAGMIIFLPVTLLAVQCSRYIRASIDAGVREIGDRYDSLGNRLTPGRPSRWMDEYDPASGPRWIGNRLGNQIMQDHMNRKL